MIKLKGVVGKVPPGIGIELSRIPFQYRLGIKYSKFRKLAYSYPAPEEVFESMKELMCHAYINIDFYKDFYDKNAFLPSKVECFSDLEEAPIVTKSDLRGYTIEERSLKGGKGFLTNTGGTTGKPLGLMMDSAAYAREWGHMHVIWDRLGYRTQDVKITLRGMNLGSRPIVYNFIHNEFQINAYCEFSEVMDALYKLLSSYKIRYIHGYPSSVYEFVSRLASANVALLERLKKHLKGVFLGSEFPAPIYRDVIEQTLGVKTISWYGHTEMAVLAAEKDVPFLYYPFQNYGYAEAVDMRDGCHLVGTTLHNYVSPLIRYDTEDLIEPVSKREGLLESFKVSAGRLGEFVVDKSGRRISLTSLIFGRHHPLFDLADFIQVSQLQNGAMTVWIASKRKADWAEYFDSDGVNMDIEFKQVSFPFRSKAGKLPLLVNKIVEDLDTE